MKRSAVWLSAAVLLAVAISAQAQDSKAPFEWKATGDSVDNFKAELVLAAPLDQSTPENTVNGYAMVTDGRTEYRKHHEGIQAKAAEIIRKAVNPVYEAALSEELNKVRLELVSKEDEKSDEDSSKSEATKITAVTDGEGGAKLVETVQKSTYKTINKGGGDEGEEQTWESKMRYTLLKGSEGKWRIEKIERWGTNWEKMDDKGEAPEEWMHQDSMLVWMMRGSDSAKVEELKQDTPENAALSLFKHVFPKADSLRQKVYDGAQKSWVELLKPLHTENALKSTEDSEKFKPTERTHEVDSVTDGADGVKKVKLKPSMEWSSATEVHVKKHGDVWKIVKVGYYEKNWENMDENGNVPEEFVEAKSVEELRWR